MVHLKSDLDPIRFLQQVSCCRGSVILCTEEGDRLDLKSELCRMIFGLDASKERRLLSGWLECAEDEDYRMLGEFCDV